MQKLVFVNGSGNEIDLTAGHYGITNWSGLSNAELNIQTQKVPFQDGSVFLDALLNDRELSFTVAINDNNDLALRYQLKRELISMLNPKLNEGYLYYTNDYLSRRIKVEPKLPIFQNKNSNDSGTLKTSVTFTACGVYWEDLEEKTAVLKNGVVENLVNEGDVKCNIDIIAWGNVQKLSVKSQNTNQQILFDKSAEPEIQGLEITTDTGKKEVKGLSLELQENFEPKFNIVLYDKKCGIYLCSFNNGDGIKRTKEFNFYENCNVISSSFVYFTKGVIYNGTSIFVSSNHKVFSSNDSYNFTQIQSLSSYNAINVIYSQKFSMFIVLCNDGNLLTSSDGEVWNFVETQLNVTNITESFQTNDVVIFNNDSLYGITSLDNFSYETIGNLSEMGIEETGNIEKLILDLYSYNFLVMYEDGNTYGKGSEFEDFTLLDFKLRDCGYILNEHCFVGIKAVETANSEYTLTLLKSVNSTNWENVEELPVISNNSPTGSIICIDDVETILIFNPNGNGCYFGHSLNNIEPLYNPVNLSQVFYDKYYKKYYCITSYGRDVYTTEDFINYTHIYTSDARLSNLSSNGKGLIILPTNNSILYSTNGQNFQSLDGFSDSYGGVAYSPKQKKFLVFNTSSENPQSIFIDDKLQTEVHARTGYPLYEGFNYLWCNSFNLWLSPRVYSEDGVNFYPLSGQNVGFSETIVYSEEKNMAIFSGHDGGIGITYDGKSVFTVDNPFDDHDVSRGAYDEKLKIFIVVGANAVHVSSNGIKWETKSFFESRSIYAIQPIQSDNILLLAPYGIKNWLKVNKTLNLINYIQSNLKLELESGDNPLQITLEPSDTSGSIIYRQKYVGV